jgi:hypothetical protein
LWKDGSDSYLNDSTNKNLESDFIKSFSRCSVSRSSLTIKVAENYPRCGGSCHLLKLERAAEDGSNGPVELVTHADAYIY